MEGWTSIIIKKKTHIHILMKKWHAYQEERKSDVTRRSSFLGNKVTSVFLRVADFLARFFLFFFYRPDNNINISEYLSVV